MAEPPPFLRHLVDGTTHVDVDVSDTAIDEHLGGIGEILGLRAEDLDGQRVIALCGLGQIERLFAAFQERPGVHQVGGGQPEPAKFADREAECKIRIPGQRREEVARWHAPAADSKGRARAAVGRNARFDRRRIGDISSARNAHGITIAEFWSRARGN